MSKKSIVVNISPLEVLKKVKNKLSAELEHEEFHQVDNEKSIGTLIFEKYFFRVNNRVALVIIADNLNVKTSVRIISTASSQGVTLNFDWGASDSFISDVEDILSDNIVY